MSTRNNHIFHFISSTKLHSNNIKFALSNVLRSKGKENSILINWTNKNIDKYRVINLNYDYNNSNYQVKDKNSVTEEVLIINYEV